MGRLKRGSNCVNCVIEAPLQKKSPAGEGRAFAIQTGDGADRGRLIRLVAAPSWKVQSFGRFINDCDRCRNVTVAAIPNSDIAEC